MCAWGQAESSVMGFETGYPPKESVCAFPRAVPPRTNLRFRPDWDRLGRPKLPFDHVATVPSPPLPS